MLEGTYVVLAQTPVGSKRGEVTFSHGVNGALRAVLNVRGLNIALSGARAECDFFELSGTISHVLMGKAPFTCTGSVEGDRLTATARAVCAKSFRGAPHKVCAGKHRYLTL